jgi:hypothetical protein
MGILAIERKVTFNPKVINACTSAAKFEIINNRIISSI